MATRSEKEKAALRKVVEADYALGIYSNVRLADKHGIPESTLRGWIKKYGWKKDNAPRVTERVKEKLLVPEGFEQTPDDDDSDEALIEAAADEVTGVALSHRRLSKKLIKSVDGIADTLNSQIEKGSITVDTNDGPMAIDIPLEYIGKVLGHATQSLERLVKIDRQSYGMDDKEEKPVDPLEDISDDKLNDKIERLLAKQNAE